MKYEHTEEGLMVMKDGLAWGEIYDDGRSTTYGWMDPTMKAVEFATKDRAKYLQNPTNVRGGRGHTRELSTSKIVKVKRTVIVETEDE